MAQIFDRTLVAALTLEWQSNSDVTLLAKIMEECKHLVEALVSCYDSNMRDDLIQESYIRIQYALKYYNPKVSDNIHNYLTTVIKNACASWMSKQMHDANITDDLDCMDELSLPTQNSIMDDEELLSELIEHNRCRFPSIDVCDIDDMTSSIYHGIKDSGNKYRYIVAKTRQELKYDINIVGTIYNSTLAYMRQKYIRTVGVVDCSGEFNLLPDLKDVLGDAAYQRLVTVFNGMTIKISC
jgi:hypothetical protein